MRVFSVVADWGERAYDALMEFGLAPLHAYYNPPKKFIRWVCATYWGLDSRTTKRVLRTSPLAVMGHSAVHEVLRRRMQIHAVRTMVVTTLCSFGDGWWIYPLLLVDVVYFQREVFAFAQEAFLLCRPFRKSSQKRFDYAMVVVVATRVMEPFVFRQVKKGVGQAVSFALRKGVGTLRSPVRVFVRQSAKWTGVAVAKGVVDNGLDWFVMVICAVAAGLVSYWMFLPMARRAMPLLTGRGAKDLFCH